MTQSFDSVSQRKILKMRDVMHQTGFSRTWIYELVKRGAFPQPRKIGKRTIRFSSAEVNAWIKEKLAD